MKARLLYSVALFFACCMVLLCPDISKGQEFAPKSALWYTNSQDNLNSVYFDYAVISYDHDTMINSLNWKILKAVSHDDNGIENKVRKRFIIRQDSDIVYLWRDTFSTVLYNFSRKQKLNDTLTIRDTGNTTLQFLLQSIDSVQVSGHYRLRFTYVRLNGTHVQWQVVQGIGGSVFSPFYFSEFDRPRIGAVRCYHDSVTDYMWPYEYKCDSTVHVGINDKSTSALKWKVFPNPATDVVTVSADAPGLEYHTCNLEILDITGKSVIHKTNLPNYYNMNISGLKPGMYFIRISTAQNQSIYKLLKY